MNWISVKDRLPEDGEEVFIFVTKRASQVKRGIEIGHHRTHPAFSIWYSLRCERFGENEVTHWMPLPEPPKEEA